MDTPVKKPIKLTMAQRTLLYVLSKEPEQTSRTYRPAQILGELGFIEWVPNDHDTARITDAGRKWLEEWYRR